MFGCLAQRTGLSQVSAGPGPFGTRKTYFASEPGRRGSRVRHSPLSPLASRSSSSDHSQPPPRRILSSRHSPLGFSRHSQPPPRLSPLSRVHSLSPLGFTRSRISGSLAVAVLTGSPPSSLSTRGDDTAPVDELDLLLRRSASLSPLGFICFAVGDERLAPFLVAHLLSSTFLLLIYFHLLRKDRSPTTSIGSQLRVNPSCVVSLFSGLIALLRPRPRSVLRFHPSCVVSLAVWSP
jgi:hypothetical protein